MENVLPYSGTALCRHSIVQVFYFVTFLQELDSTLTYSPCLLKDRAFPQAHTCMLFRMLAQPDNDGGKNPKFCSKLKNVET